MFRQSIFLVPAAVEGALLPALALGRVGSALCIVGLLSAVLILVNLEASLRASTGTKRAQIKFMLLGVGTIFAVSIYTMNQTLLFATVSPTMQTVNSFAVVLGNGLIGVALARHCLGSVSVSLSPTLLASSLTVLLVGMYLLVVGVLTKIISVVGSTQLLPWERSSSSWRWWAWRWCCCRTVCASASGTSSVGMSTRGSMTTGRAG